ncbi:hypothetical protein [uncultured Herbaspirillum sp.]|uniref:hypothetical protein n=1 Tax=uncultured Herbaspirillum sp. TaxID=160236 RepID=UPI00260D64C7|nr:hypothetical protein [uncultured Herbaspirillum sp.]
MDADRTETELTDAQLLLLIGQLKLLKEVAESLVTTYEEIMLHPAAEHADGFRALAHAAVKKAMNMD